MTEFRRDFKALVGQKLGPCEDRIDADRVHRFRLAVGDSGVQEVPPTYLTVFRQLEVELFEVFGISITKVLHTEQEYTLFRPLKPGMEILYETLLANALQKKGKNIGVSFLVFETRFFERTNPVSTDPIALSKTTIVVREVVRE